MYVCSCRAITESQVRAAVAQGMRTVPDLIQAFGLDDPTCCGRCERDLRELADASADRAPVSLAWSRVIGRSLA